MSKTKTFKNLKAHVDQGGKIALADFDTYNYYDENAMKKKYVSYMNKCKKDHVEPVATLQDFLNIQSMKDVFGCSFMPAGHAFVIKALLQGDLEVTDRGDVLDHSGVLNHDW